MYHDMYIYEYLWYVDTWKLCKWRQVINLSMTCVEKIRLSMLDLHEICLTKLTCVVVWCLGKCQNIGWMVIWLFIRYIELVII